MGDQSITDVRGKNNPIKKTGQNSPTEEDIEQIWDRIISSKGAALHAEAEAEIHYLRDEQNPQLSCPVRFSGENIGIRAGIGWIGYVALHVSALLIGRYGNTIALPINSNSADTLIPRSAAAQNGLPTGLP